jgi:pyrroloquinoline quinone biosynthesis protein B
MGIVAEPPPNHVGLSQLRLHSEQLAYNPAMAHPTLILSGTAQDGGFPTPWCRCPHCRAAIERRVMPRAICSAILDTDDGYVWIDTPPDWSAQIARLQAADPIRWSWGRFRGVILTHLHWGHVGGIGLLGKETLSARDVPVWATPACSAALADNGVIGRLVAEKRIDRRNLLDSPDIGGVTVGGFQVPHRNELGDTVAISLSFGGAETVICTDIDKLEDVFIDRVAYAKTLVFDATFARTDELRHRGLAEVPHPAVSESAPRFRKRNVNAIYTHFNHTNPMILGGREAASFAEGYPSAVDGQVIAL